ncbi:MAG: ferredoxin [Rhodobiaceae bacterium]|nr:ferredoxin [Rhodobiaceae bacterium]MCC0056061.1 ferredoxin [Rhodobiaceae bacterium]
MKIILHTENCMGCGACNDRTPEVFGQDELTNMVLLLDPTPPPDLHDSVRAAAANCPTATIELLDE